MATPAFRIEADGEDITARIQDRLTSLRIVDDSGQQSDSLELALDDRDKLLPMPRSGAVLKVWLGYRSGGPAPVYMGAYAVDEVGLTMGGPRSMTIKASSAALAPALVKERKTRSWDNKTLQEITEQIAKENGLQVVIKGKGASQKILHEDQTNESDQNFLTRLADRFQAVIKPADNKLVMVDRAAGQGGPTQQIDITQALDWSATLKNRGAFGSVEARYIEREGAGVSDWKNVEQKVKAGGTAGGGSWTGESGTQLPAFQIQKLFRNKAEAEAAAKSQLQSLQSGEVKITVRLSGDPSFRINAEGQVVLRNFRPYVDGQWFVRQVTHELGSGGYITTVECGTEEQDGNNDWQEGSDGPRGRNNRLPASQKAAAIADAASRSRGMGTRGGPDGGNNACLYSVNRVLRSAGITPPWGNSVYVPNARAVLAGGAGTRLSGPEPGAIAIMRDNGSPPYPHIGIVQRDGSIISNSSSRGSFSWVASPSSYSSYYGRTPEYWRLK
jgi:phage protein D